MVEGLPVSPQICHSLCGSGVNISAQQLNESGFFKKVQTTIYQSNIDVNRLKIELTESSFVRDLERGSTILTALTDMGISIELDDFGTGYS